MSVGLAEYNPVKPFTHSATTTLNPEDGLNSQQKLAALKALRPRFEAQPEANIGEGVAIGKFEVIGDDD